MKQFMIRSDMEGLSGVVHDQQVDPRGCDYAYGLEMLKADLQACLAGLFAGGADEVLIYDEHFDGRNIHPAWLPQAVRVICGKPPYRADWAGGLDAKCAGMIMLGFHARAGEPDALLAHTYEPDIAKLVLNGQEVGEIGIETAIAGDMGVPLLMLTGDSAGVAEAEHLVAGVVGVRVKQSLGARAAEVLPLTQSTGAIRAAAERVARAPRLAQPWRIRAPVTLDVHLHDNAYLRAVRELRSGQMVHPHVLRLQDSSTLDVWADYWQLKLQAQRRARELS